MKSNKKIESELLELRETVKRNAIELEEKNRELLIEAALERVRARTMAMQHSEELAEASFILDSEVRALGIQTRGCAFNIYGENESTEWFSSEQGTLPTYKTPREDVFLPYYEAGQRGETMLIEEFAGEACAAHYEYLCTLPIMGDALKEMIAQGGSFPTRQVDHVTYFKYGYLLFITLEQVPEAHAIFKRFAKVFEQAYTRFLDLQRAEAQTREAQINLAVERVRAKALAMFKSDEILEVVAKLKEEVKGLDIPGVIAATIFLNEEDDKVRMWDLSTLDKDSNGYQVHFDITFKLKKRDPNLYIKRAWENPENYFVEKQEAKDFKRIIAWLRENNKDETAAEVEEFIESAQLKCLHHAVKKLNNGKLAIDLLNPPSDEMETILTKMGAAFDLAYKRFEDLKNAERQTRESQIELALEKVRARSMAMQSSDELVQASDVMYEELSKLDINTIRIGICTMNAKTGAAEIWSRAEKDKRTGNYILGAVPKGTHPVFDNMVKAWKVNKPFYSNTRTGAEVRKYYEKVAEHLSYPLSKRYNYKETITTYFFREGSLNVVSTDPLQEADNAVMLRFAKVFGQVYRRFLDLQQAEAQAREAQVQLALERVRARTMAMHKSEELAETAAEMFQQMQELNITPERVNICLFNGGGDTFDVWATDQGGLKISQHFTGSFKEPTTGVKVFKAWKQKKKSLIIDLFGRELNDWVKYVRQEMGLTIKNELLKDHRVHTCAFFSDGMVMTTTPEALPEESVRLLERFADVFNLTYRRFLDLQKAEAQAREAQIEAALERVRSRTMAMQSSDELSETSAILFKQLIHLGIAPNRLYIGIANEDNTNIEFWITDEDGSKVSTMFSGDAANNSAVKKMYDGWKKREKFRVIDIHGKELNDYLQYLGEELHVPFNDGLSQKRRIQYLGYFARGFIGMASPEEQPEETMNLLQRFAAVFNLTFIRFNDLKVAEAHAIQSEKDLIEIKSAKIEAENALTELKSAQSQLIQSEKMASLGELTAGIAHEIQNPLNFVNNFSEVSSEMMDEMKEELATGNQKEAMEIAEDIKLNLEKITHHGRRADSIVKGMLEHSRASTGTKEPTDINALADEYLRLSYHGLRAKDKSFNADIKTDFDESLGKVDVVPQNIGRVLLNLFNNAFYAVNERRAAPALKGDKAGKTNFKPLVSLSTTRVSSPLGAGGGAGGAGGNAKSHIEIRVRDNGNGVPKKILDKIFQPFFTTKPTGQGTGLGLSLSYDIIKAHGGELKVETKEGEGTEFTIFLPNV